MALLNFDSSPSPPKLHPYIQYSSYVLGAFTLYHTIASFWASRRHASNANRLGATSPFAYRDKYPLGLNNLMRVLKADRTNTLPPYMVERSEEMEWTPTYQYNLLGTLNLFPIDPLNIQAILATQFDEFETGEIRRRIFFPLLGNGIFTTDNKAWEHSRALLRPQFARHQVADLDMMEQHVQNLMLALPTDPGSRMTAPVDLQVLFFRFTIDSATEFLFGESVNSQLAELPQNTDNIKKPANRDEKIFAHNFDRGQAYLALRGRVQDWYWLINNAEFRQNCKVVHDFVDYYVNIALSKPQSSVAEKGSDKKERYVFLDALALETRDPIELRSQLLNILLAGRDTTAGLLGWLFYHLARNQSTFQKLRSVVLSEFGTYAKPHDMTFANLKSCRYLQYCLNETLRLNPLVPVNSRKARRDTTLPRGGGPDGKSKVYVKSGTNVDYSVHVMHRRRDIWGEDAEEFKPERWEGRRVGWEFLPFNGGPRICLGQQLALTEAGYVTARLIQRFKEIVNVDPEKRVFHHVTLTTSTGNGVKVRLVEDC